MRGLRRRTIAYIKRGSHLITQARPSSNSASILGVWIAALGLAILGVMVITGSLKGLPPVALFVTPIAVPLRFVGCALVRVVRDLGRVLVFDFRVAVVIAGLGVVQGIVGLDFLNPAELAPELTLAHYDRQAPISGTLVPRSTSVFVSDARFAWYLLLMLLLGIGTVAYLLARRQGTRVAVASVGIIAAAIVLSGSRGTFMYAVVSTGVLAGAFLQIVGPRLRKRVGRVVTLGVTAVGLAVVALLAFYPEALGARRSWYYETIEPWSSESELAWRIWGYPVANFLGAFSSPGWLSGYGIGTSS